jgi:hypothetical protein
MGAEESPNPKGTIKHNFFGVKMSQSVPCEGNKIILGFGLANQPAAFEVFDPGNEKPISVTGELPPGMSFSDVGIVTEKEVYEENQLVGTPTTIGYYQFSITFAGENGCPDYTYTFIIKISAKSP